MMETPTVRSTHDIARTLFVPLAAGLLLLAALLLVSGCGGTTEDGGNTYTREASKVDDSLEADDIATTAYLDEGDFAKAEAYWRRAVEIRGDYDSPNLQNNLALALLQQERNEEAYDILSSLLDSETSSDRENACYMLNFMVAAHACGKPSTVLFENARAKEAFGQLALDAEDDPGTYMEILLGILYNAIYMDMELPQEDFLAGHFDYGAVGTTDEALEADVAAGGDLSAVTERIISAIDAKYEKHFGTSDPDNGRLQEYADGLFAQ